MTKSTRTSTNLPMEMDRRTFVKLAAIAGTAGSAAVLVGCAQDEVLEDVTPPRESSNQSTSIESEPTFANSTFPRHEPYGQGIGACPGRVAWAFDPTSVAWDGDDHWWRVEHFDEAAVRAMVDACLRSLAGDTTTCAEAWQVLFESHNARHGKSGGYIPGQKIAIKANMNGAGTFGTDEDSDMSFTNPVVLRALLLSLVEDAVVVPADVTIYDACRIFPGWFMEYCSQEALAGVRFRHVEEGSERDALPDAGASIMWSQEVSGAANCVPTCVSEAEYLINLANLKGHSYGITLCAKNHFGTLMNTSRMRPPEAAGIHLYVANSQMGTYTVLVDLLANTLLGQKTVLWMLDAIVCAPSEGAQVTRESALWESEPFAGGFTASVFASQDPVALDSVGADFLMNEPAVTSRNATLAGNAAVENYLHEASLVAMSPSGVRYLNGAGEVVENLGVHEHWDNPFDRRYARNLGASEGIELVRV